MNDINQQNEISKKTTTSNSERTEKDFHFKESFKIDDWDALKQDYFQSLTTNNGVKFKFLIRKASQDAIKFLILKESVTKPCLATIELLLTNPSSKKKVTRQLQHNFNMISRIAEISVDLSNFSSDDTSNAHINKSKSLLISLSIDHHSQIVSDIPIVTETNEHKTKKNEEIFLFYEEQVPRVRRQTPSDYYSFTADQYCGIRNQGSTCFLNSILQAFFHLPIFRRLLFQIDVDKNADHQSNIIWNLRQLFAQMSETTEPVSTRQLTNSFGWNDDQVVDTEQDLFEFYEKILDLLEEKLKKTRFEGEIRKIFYGKSRRYIRCTNVPEEKITIESFNNISLEIRKFKNIEESFKDQIKPELKTGDNCIRTNDYGLQEAEMGVEFLEFPYVVYFRLNRIDYNPKKGKTVRNNSKCEFPISIDMSNYLAEDSPQKKEDMIYELFGVLVHAGEVNSGHFYAFLRTNLNDGIDKWYRFNDSQVSSVDRKQAVTDNFGGKKNEERQHYSAYILIYMRRSELPKLFCPVDTHFLSGYIDEGNKNKNEDESILVQLFTINHVDSETHQFNRPNELMISLSSSFEDLYKAVSKRLKMDDIQIFYCYKNNLFGEIEYSNEIKVDSFVSSSFFVDSFNGIRNDILIFVEFYSPLIESPKIRLLKSLSVSFNQKICSILPIVESFVKIKDFKSEDENCPYLVYVCNNGQIKEVSLFSTFGDHISSNGAFVIFQFAPQNFVCSEKVELNDVQNFFFNNNDLVQKYFDHFEEELPLVADDYYSFINSSINLKIIDVSIIENDQIINQFNNEMNLSIPGLFNVGLLEKFIIKLYNIELDMSKHKFFYYKKNFVCPINKSDDDIFNSRIIREMFMDDDEVYHILITDDKNKIARVELVSTDNPPIIIANFFNSNLVASSLIDAQVLLDDSNTKYRLLQINTKKESIKTVFDASLPLFELRNSIRIEAVPKDQRRLFKNEFLIKCRNVLSCDDKFQDQKPIPSPFLFKVKEDELFAQTKERILSNIENKNNNTFKFTLSLKANIDKDLCDDDILINLADESSELIIIHIRENTHKIGDADGLMIFN